ncbi:hypothetical protein A2160_02505 [Candidatus Beckwithbacteria bacterium RBG_13_42_9]|uniref:Transport permease protein n=1 Tax=Candidatus Beckwithbacteria bacterium RBG_13_42_9 TaxID=1797457 RepID=A0A1F5E7I1_9BACT|nr:MAG: hypothetical protein A2160_02505 [Candidatus Beckwithbacteria bacterium RBG_13_42_9]
MLKELKELYQYRYLITTFVIRDVKARYRQTSLGIGWAIIQPLFLTGIFTIIFGNFLKVSTSGIPYPVFSFIALAAWTFISRSITAGSANLIGNSTIISKVYFPREVIPLATVISSLVDFGISSILMFLLLIFYHISFTWHLVLIPIIFLIQILMAISLALFSAAATVVFRDLLFAIPFLVQILMYGSPIIYSVKNLQRQFQILFYFNPITGIIEGYRSVLLYHEIPNLIYLGISFGFSIILLWTSYVFFKRIERYLADVV